MNWDFLLLRLVGFPEKTGTRGYHIIVYADFTSVYFSLSETVNEPLIFSRMLVDFVCFYALHEYGMTTVELQRQKNSTDNRPFSHCVKSGFSNLAMP
jgi:hypothetical protein